MTKKIPVEKSILLFAFRYALERSSYAPVIVVQNIKENIDEFSNDEIRTYIREVEERSESGEKTDSLHWLDFKNFLTIELRKRAEKNTF